MTEKQKIMIKKKEECKRLWETTDLPGEVIAKKVGVSPTTFWRWKNDNEWKRNSSGNNNPPTDNSGYTQEDGISINFKSISLKEYNELVYTIQMDNALSMDTKGFVLEFLPFLLTNVDPTFISTTMPSSDLTCWKELVDNGYIVEYQWTRNIRKGNKTYEIKNPNASNDLETEIVNLRKNLEKLEKENNRLNEKLKAIRNDLND